MFIDAKELNAGIGFITSVAGLDKKNPGILFDIGDNYVKIFYSSGERAIEHTVPAGLEDDDYRGKVVFEYQRLIDTLATSKTAGNIHVGGIEFKLTKNPDGSGKAIITIVKTVVFESESEETERVVSVNKHELSWWDETNVTTKQQGLFKPVCDNMYEENEAEIWDATEFCNMLSDVSYGDSKVCYITPAAHGAFESNTASLVYVRTKHEPKFGINLNSNIIPALTSIFKGEANVMVNVLTDPQNKPFAYIFFTEDKKTSVYTKAGAIVRTHGTRMQNHQEMVYKDFQASFMTEVIKDSMKSAVAINAGVKGIIKFVRCEDGTVDMVVSAENSGASINNQYNLKCTSFNATKPDTDNKDEIFEFSVTLKNLLDEISHNRFGYTAFDFFIGPEDRKYLRIGFFELEDAQIARTEWFDAKRKELAELGETESSQNLVYDTEAKMESREKYIRTFVYIVTE